MGMYCLVANTFCPDTVNGIITPNGIQVNSTPIHRGTSFTCVRGDDTFTFTLVDASFAVQAAESEGRTWIGHPDVPVAYFGAGSWRARNTFAPYVCNLLHEHGVLLDGPFDVPGYPNCNTCGAPLRSKDAQQCFACGADWH